jgi:hypothetical protein
LSPTKESRTHNGERTVSSVVLGKLDLHLEKWTLASTIIQAPTQSGLDLNIRAESMKLPEGTIRF